MNEPRFGLELPEDPAPVWLASAITLGRHLDNDIVLAGEDVRDFHVRFELMQRGLRMVVLEGATAHVGDAPVEGTIGLMAGDEITIGRNAIRVVVDGESGVCHWALHEPGVGQGIPIGKHFLVGRADDCAIRINEGHVSRRHALLSASGRWVWVRDLGSSNGTFVNGERLQGACRLFHGDEVAFDQARYQLIGDAPDLTPIRPSGDEPDQLPPVVDGESPAPVSLETVEIGALTGLDADLDSTPAPDVRGPALWGRTGPVAGRVFPLNFGRQTIGRADNADIVIVESSVSSRHAEVDLKPDGTYLVNLISTNGTWVNGVDIHTRRLVPGDVVHFGRVRMDYLEPRIPRQHRRVGVWWIVVLVGLGAGLVFWLA